EPHREGMALDSVVRLEDGARRVLPQRPEENAARLAVRAGWAEEVPDLRGGGRDLRRLRARGYRRRFHHANGRRRWWGKRRSRLLGRSRAFERGGGGFG